MSRKRVDLNVEPALYRGRAKTITYRVVMAVDKGITTYFIAKNDRNKRTVDVLKAFKHFNKAQMVLDRWADWKGFRFRNKSKKIARVYKGWLIDKGFVYFKSNDGRR